MIREYSKTCIFQFHIIVRFPSYPGDNPKRRLEESKKYCLWFTWSTCPTSTTTSVRFHLLIQGLTQPSTTTSHYHPTKCYLQKYVWVQVRIRFIARDVSGIYYYFEHNKAKAGESWEAGSLIRSDVNYRRKNVIVRVKVVWGLPTQQHQPGCVVDGWDQAECTFSSAIRWTLMFLLFRFLFDVGFEKRKQALNHKTGVFEYGWLEDFD